MVRERIVVGVDGSAAAQTALVWAADEARLRNAGLLIVHSVDVHDAAVAARSGEPAVRATEQAERGILGHQASLAAIRQPGVAVSTLLSYAAPADALVDLSSTVDLVVVGTHGHASLVGSILGSVSHLVAAQARCPVAVVPEPAALQAWGQDRVIAGVANSLSCASVLATAFAEAQVRQCALTVAWADPGTDEQPPSPDLRPGWLHRHLEPLRAGYPDIAVTTQRLDGAAGPALRALAGSAVAIVIGAHHSSDRWSTRLGAVPLAVLDDAPCPVIIAGHHGHGAEPPAFSVPHAGVLS